MMNKPCETCEMWSSDSLCSVSICKLCTESGVWKWYEQYNPEEEARQKEELRRMSVYVEENSPKPCPWCGSVRIGFSSKTTGKKGSSGKYNKRKVSMYCKDCKTYGPRTIIEGTSYNGSDNEGHDVALRIWNTRRR